MSIQVMTEVWKLALEPAESYVLLALADFADDNGYGVDVSVPRVAWKTGYSQRQVQRIVRLLESRGALILTREATPRLPSEYRIVTSAISPKKPYVARGDKMSGVTKCHPTFSPGRGDKMSGVTRVPSLDSPSQLPLSILIQDSFTLATPPHQESPLTPHKNQESKAAHAHEGTRVLTPHQLVVNAYYEALGRNPFDVGREYARHVVAGVELAKGGRTPEDVAACTAWLVSDPWRQAKGRMPALADVAAAFPAWLANGRPETYDEIDDGRGSGIDRVMKEMRREYRQAARVER